MTYQLTVENKLLKVKLINLNWFRDTLYIQRKVTLVNRPYFMQFIELSTLILQITDIGFIFYKANLLFIQEESFY